VARHAILRRAAKNVVGVTLDARDCGVLAVEPINACVLETLQTIRPIVTSETRFTHLAAMIGDEWRVPLTMTIDACRQHIHGFDLGVLGRKTVTRPTRYRGPGVIDLMIDECEPKLIVRKTIGRCARHADGATLVIGVTRDAIF